MANLLVPNKIYIWLAVLWTLTIVVLCLESTADLPKVKISGFDKIAHTIIHLVFTFLWFMSLMSLKLKFKKAIFFAFLFSVAFGISIEILQQLLTTTRKADILDVMANTFGSFLAVCLVHFLENRKIINTL